MEELEDYYQIRTNKLQDWDRGDIIAKNKTMEPGSFPVYYYKVNGIGRIIANIIIRNPMWFRPINKEDI